jgi:hypothetical protein
VHEPVKAKDRSGGGRPKKEVFVSVAKEETRAQKAVSRGERNKKGENVTPLFREPERAGR